MAVKPILFNTDMVRAILSGEKSVTRRVMKPQPVVSDYRIEWNGYIATKVGEKYEGFDNLLLARIFVDRKSPYQRGDILYVRETWAENPHPWDGTKYMYRASIHPADCDLYKWRPSIHMPKEVARIWLRVTDVRVERLKDISAEQIVKEGIRHSIHDHLHNNWKLIDRRNFERLWNSTIKQKDLGLYGWQVLPWVWVIEFEQCGKPAD